MSSATVTATDPTEIFRRNAVAFVALGAHDVRRMAHLIRSCTVETQHLRFHRALGDVSEDFARTQSDFDGLTRFGLGLVDAHGDLVATASLSVHGQNRADFSLLVRDDHQGRGLGTALLEVVVRHAELLGLDRLHARVLACNRIMLGVLARVSPMTVGPMRHGMVHIELRVSPSAGIQMTA